MQVAPHDRFGRRLALSPRSIADFAASVGDENPLHRDAEAAAQDAFPGVIASGPQTAGLLMGAVASHFSRAARMVGLGFEFFFRAAVPADQPFELEWLVVGVRPTHSGARRLVELRGRLRLDSGRTAVGAKGRILVW